MPARLHARAPSRPLPSISALRPCAPTTHKPHMPLTPRLRSSSIIAVSPEYRRNRTSVALAPSAPDRKAWMPPSCCLSDMNAASTPYPQGGNGWRARIASHGCVPGAQEHQGLDTASQPAPIPAPPASPPQSRRRQPARPNPARPQPASPHEPGAVSRPAAPPNPVRPPGHPEPCRWRGLACDRTASSVTSAPSRRLPSPSALASLNSVDGIN
jgi:hypothetical protein